MGTENITSVEALGTESVPFLIGMAVGLMLLAFFGFKLLRIELVLTGILLGYSLGYDTFGAMVGDSISGVNIALILGIVCAVVGALLAAKVYRFMIFLIGGLTGFAVGSALFPSLVDGFGSLPVSEDTLVLIMSIVVAIILAFIIYKLFKPLYIVFTSLVGGFLSLGILSIAIFGENDSLISIFAIAGLVVGVFAMIYQFKSNKDRYL